ncbi:MAG TPA: hypothetical protein VMT12_07525 [Syntrophales bacterium]|nr:hypothetical protein [Syntrophales bacterium]
MLRVATFRGFAALLGNGQVVVLEGDEKQAVDLPRVAQRTDDGLDGDGLVAASDPCCDGEGLVGFKTLGNCASEARPQSLSGHIHDTCG